MSREVRRTGHEEEEINTFSVKFTLCVLRLRISKRANACSATASGEYAGTCTRESSFLARCPKSTLLQPAFRKAIGWMPCSLSMSVTGGPTSSLTKTQAMLCPLAREAVVSSNRLSKKEMECLAVVKKTSCAAG